MFFTAFVGPAREMGSWHAAARLHAADLGLTCTVVTHPRGTTETRAAVAWLAMTPLDPARHVRLTRTHLLAGPVDPLTAAECALAPDAMPAGVADAWASPSSRVLIHPDDGHVTVSVPPASPEQVYWMRHGRGLLVADDLRFCARLGTRRLDERGALALLQFGTVPPPRTIYRDVRRVPNGHVAGIEAERLVTLRTLTPPAAAGAPATADPARWIAGALDASLARVPDPAVLLFSGGVDSGLLAARLAHLGRRDVGLLGYRFNPDDRESAQAAAMATHLGLSFDTVDHEPERLGDLLSHIGQEYSFPFGDLSTVPMHALVQRVRMLARPGTTVIEGTGADGAFGLAARYPLWARAYATPGVVRRRVKRVFRALTMWRHDSDLTRLAGFLSRSANLPLELSVLSQHPLEGIAYSMPPDVARELAESVAAQFRPLLANASPQSALSLLDVVLVCAGTMAPKSFDPLRAHGLRPLYPFLDPRVVLGGLSLPPSVTCADGEAKSLLKRLLAESVPRELVYRPKSGFTPPYVAICASPVFQDTLRDVVLSARNPLIDAVDARMVRRMANCARRAEPMAPGVHDFLWGLTFASVWLTSDRVSRLHALAC